MTFSSGGYLWMRAGNLGGVESLFAYSRLLNMDCDQLTQSWIPVDLGEVHVKLATIFFAECFKVVFTSNHLHLEIPISVVNYIGFVYNCFGPNHFVQQNLT